MVHTTPARKEAQELRDKASTLSRDAQALAGIEGAEDLAEKKAAEARELRDKARELADVARLEDITVRQNPINKRSKKGEEKTYYRWVCSWQDGDKTVTKYLGSCAKMSKEGAMEKARRMKAEALESYHTSSIQQRGGEI